MSSLFCLVVQIGCNACVDVTEPRNVQPPLAGTTSLMPPAARLDGNVQSTLVASTMSQGHQIERCSDGTIDWAAVHFKWWRIASTVVPFNPFAYTFPPKSALPGCGSLPNQRLNKQALRVSQRVMVWLSEPNQQHVVIYPVCQRLVPWPSRSWIFYLPIRVDPIILWHMSLVRAQSDTVSIHAFGAC